MARILLAEDEAAVREFVGRALEHHGHQVTAVADGGAALAALGAGDYDLLVTDIVMPGMDGIALALKVSKAFPGLPILMMTGYAAQRERAHNLDSLIQDVVMKPFGVDEIAAKVTEALG